jgi:Ca2+-transporting ATPase
MIFAGLQGMMDPPRPDAKTSIQSCQKAGIRVIMITGDHTITAKAIGSYLGICSPKSQVVNGSELEQMSDRDLFNKVQEVSVFARVSPNHKLRIVEQLMKHDEIVAVTGDGVNDAPALKAAHIGIAMGKTGTDVAKEASDMVLRDDNFASIFKAVYEGRVVFENIRKAVAFLIPIGFSAIITLFITTILGLPTPFLPAQLLWINLVASGIPDLSLAFEPGDKQILDKPPRKRGEGIMSKILLQRSILVGLLISMGVVIVFIMSLNNGLSLETGRTMAVTTMVLFQFFQVLNARSETVSIFKISIFSNKFLLFGLLGSAIAHILVLYIPAFEWLFSMTPLSFLQWVLIIIMASSVIVAVETDKALRRKFNLNS